MLAQEEAVLNKCRYIGPEHILVGLFREEEGLAAKVLTHLGVELETLRTIVEEHSQGPVPELGDEPPKHNEKAKKALELSLRSALNLGHNYIGTEHLLLGLIQSPTGQGNKALRILEGNFGLEAEDISNEVIRMLSGPKAPILTRGTKDTPTYVPQSASEKPKAKTASSVDRDLLVTAVTLGRQFPEAPADKIAEATVLLFR